MFWDRKKATTSVLQKRNASGGKLTAGPTPMKEENVRNEDGTHDLRHVAAQNMIDAFHAKSADALNRAQQNFIDLHLAAKQQESEPEPEK